MNTETKRMIVFVVASLGSVLTAAGQASGNNQTAPAVLLSLATSSANRSAPEIDEHETVVREIDDPHSGDRWLLMRNPTCPGGPGRLVLAAAVPSGARQSRAEGSSPSPVLTVIHTGDRLIVEENTPLVAARLEAVALGPASPGSPLKVRLALGGRVVRAVALSAGRAAFAPQFEVRP